MSKINIVMDASQYDMFRLCECRFNYRYNLNKVTAEKNKSLDTGTLIHIACEYYFNSLKSGAQYQYAVEAALMKLREAGVMDSGLESGELSHVINTMEEYFDFWRVADQNRKIESVESPFIYLLYEDDEIRVYMSGKIDLVVTDERYTNLPVDHKSFSRTSPDNRLGNQFRNYCRAMNSSILEVDKIGLQKSLKSEQKFIRTPVSYDQLMLDSWRDNVVKVIFHYLSCVSDNSWPMNETSCDKFNRRCEYYEVCDSSGDKAKQFKLDSLFMTVEPWDVTKIMKKSSEVLEK